MSALNTYLDFVATTGPAYYTGPENVVNEDVKRSYLLGSCLKGRDMNDVLQGGEKIKDVILFEDAGEYENYLPNQVFSPTNPQVTSTIEANWRFSKFNYVVTDQELVLQMGEGLTDKARFHKYKNLRRVKEQAAWTGGINGMEDNLTLDAPVTGDMEAAGGTKPYNLFAFITEDETNYHPSGWTNIMGINPATESRWRNQVSTYDHTTPFDTSNGVYAAFDDMIEDVRFEVPGTKGQYFEDDNLNKMKILTSKQGRTLYKQALRAANDRLLGGFGSQDPDYKDPAYSGIPVTKIDNLSTAAVYTSAAEASGEPRYYFVNCKYLRVFFHSKKYFQQVNPPRTTNQPFSVTIYFDCYWNLFCRSRQRQGIIAPSSPTN